MGVGLALVAGWSEPATAHNCYGTAPWSTAPIFGSAHTFFADMTGDGVADSIAVNNEVQGGGGTAPLSVIVHFGAGWNGGFAPEEHLFTVLPSVVTTVVGDVTGDNKADLVYQHNNRIYVQSAPTSLGGAPVAWTTDAVAGNLFLGDVDGDDRSDLIAVQTSGVRVRRSTGSSFGPLELWMPIKLQTPIPERGFAFADVTGDGRVDAILVFNAALRVRRSTGTSFGAIESWTSGPFSGSHGNYFADVTGDGRADAIAVDASAGVTVRRSFGTFFDVSESWLPPTGFDPPSPFVPGFHFAPETATQRADLILATLTGLQGRPNMGSYFLCNWN